MQEMQLLTEPADDLFQALSSHHRRELLAALLTRSAYSALEYLDVHPGGADPDRLRIMMVHNHLPRLAHMGFIEWDRDDHVIARGPRFDEVRPYLQY